MRKHPASYILILFVSFFYVLPIIYWNILNSSATIPKDFPIWTIILRTVFFSAITSALSVLAAYPMVLLWRFSGSKARNAILLLMIVPLVMGLLARNYSWVGMLSSSEVVGSFGLVFFGMGRILYTSWAFILVMTCIFLPVSFFIVVQSAASICQEQINAARALGVPDGKIVFAVVLPFTYRAAVLAFAFNFALALGFFVTPDMLGGGNFDFIGNAILMYLKLGSFDIASAISIFFLFCVMIPIFGILWFAWQRRKLTAGR